MKPVYEIKFLASKDFDRLPKTETNGANISDSLGFYNPYINKIYIRHTAIPELDKYLLEHEFDHLLEKDATDEDEFGIRHKKKKGFMGFLQKFYNPLNIGGMGPLSDDSKGVAYTANKNKPENVQADQANAMSSFGNLGYGQPQSQGVSFGSSQSPFTDQQSTSQGLNQGLSQQSINPLSQDPYSQYGRPSGRLYF